MSTASLNSYLKSSVTSSSTIFANRNTLYRKFHQLHKIKQVQKHAYEVENEKKNKMRDQQRMEQFKNKLNMFLDRGKRKEFQSLGRHTSSIGVIDRKNRGSFRKRSGQNKQQQGNASDINESNSKPFQVQLVNYLHSTSQNLRARQSPQTLHKYHAPKPIKSTKRFYTQPNNSNDHSELSKTQVPICTINFVQFRKTTTATNSFSQTQPKNVYNNYLMHRGITMHNYKEETEKMNRDVVRRKSLTKSQLEELQQVQPIKSSQVLIVQKPTIEHLQQQKMQLMKSSKMEFRHRKHSKIRIKINKIEQTENIVGPWSKKGFGQQEGDQSSEM